MKFGGRAAPAGRASRVVASLPPSIGSSIASLLLVLGLVAGALPRANAADMINGQRLYGLHCAGCHGPRGISVMPNAPSFARGERLMQPDMMLLNSIRSGRNAMPGFFGLLQDREILDVISFLRTMQ